MLATHNEIIKDTQIWKFCFYGFFKNLRFFEPYLLIYLLGMGLNLFNIGILLSVREAITYIFEVPSGIIADHYGKRKELLLCFVFYIASFIFFFMGSNFIILSIGMVFFGLGEAFRSGTHKAIILSYLEHKGWFSHKAFVYGRTRSYSLLGSAISSFFSILLVLNLPSLRWIFLVCIIPYILDFMLILSYPKYLDDKVVLNLSLKGFYLESIKQLKSVNSNLTLKKVLASSALYDGVFKAIKDYIQPILKILLVTAGIGIVMGLNIDKSLNVYLGLIYGVFYIFSSIASKNIYRLTAKISSYVVFEKFFDVMGLLLLVLSYAIRQEFIFIAILVYFGLYIMKDARRPVFVDVCSDYMNKNQRATVLSIESQIRALFMMIMAPTFGWIAVHYSVGDLFFVIGVLLLIVNRFMILEKNNR
ncbi:MAG: MFS transporter [Gudongella sp.]|nr:MFS transporter [Gudongella sp.]